MNDTTREKTDGDHFDRFLSRQLRNSSAYIADDGFTQNVMAALPQGVGRWQERLIIGLALLFATLLVAVVFPWAEIAGFVWRWSLTMDFMALVQAGMGVTAAIFALCGLWLLRQMRLL